MQVGFTEHLELQQLMPDEAIGGSVARTLDIVVQRHSNNGVADGSVVETVPKQYHNGLHTFSVVKDALRAARALHLNHRDTSLVTLDAVFHDVVYDLCAPANANEAQSADELDIELAKYGSDFTAVDRQIAKIAILGTETWVEKSEYGYRLVQRAAQQTYHSKREQTIANIIASADLGRLHSLTGPYFSHRLYQEQAGIDDNTPLDPGKLVGFQIMQLDLLAGGYTYPHRDLQKFFMTHTKEVVRYNELLLEDLATGQLTTWEQILQRDIAFATSQQIRT